MILSGSLLPDCSDLAFVASPLELLVESNFIPFYVEGGCNTTDTPIWVQIPDLPSLVSGDELSVFALHGCGSSYVTSTRLSWSDEFVCPRLAAGCGSWDSVSELNGRFPLISTFNVGNRGSATHTHTSDIDGADRLRAPGSGGTCDIPDPEDDDPPIIELAGSSHSHDFTEIASLPSGSNVPGDVLDVSFCSTISGNLDFSETDILVGFTETPLPPQATPAASTVGLFLRGGAYTGVPVVGSTTHDHSLVSPISSSGPSSTVDCDPGSGIMGATTLHGHDIDVQTGDADTLPPYVTISWATVAFDFVVDRRAAFLAKSLPPMGWESVWSSPEKLLLGSATPGTIGGALTHIHSYTLDVSSAIASVQADAESGFTVASSGHSHEISFVDPTGDLEEAEHLPPSYRLKLMRMIDPVGEVTDQTVAPGVDMRPNFCNGTAFDQAGVCAGRGMCWRDDKCSCITGWCGADCRDHCCERFLPGDARTCSSNGFCSGPETCDCTRDTGGAVITTVEWGGPVCGDPICYGVVSTEPLACAGHGSCDAPDDCDCDTDWTDSDCSMPMCFGERQDAYDSVCSARGHCFDANICDCTLLPDGTPKETDPLYGGPECADAICFGIVGNSADVCSGHGECGSPDVCICSFSFDGIECEKLSSSVYYIVGGVVGGLVGIIILVVVILGVIGLIVFIRKKKEDIKYAQGMEMQYRSPY